MWDNFHVIGQDSGGATFELRSQLTTQVFDTTSGSHANNFEKFIKIHIFD
jgi:hypothetical protein